MKKFIPISGCLPVEGTQNLYTHTKLPGLLLKRVDSVAQAIACGGIAWSEDADNAAIYGALGVDSRAYGFGEKTVRNCAAGGVEANQVRTRLSAVSGYPANSMNRFYYDSFEVLALGPELALASYKGANINSTTANTRVMGIVSDADYGFIRSGVPPIKDMSENAAWIHGYVGKVLNFGSLRHIVNMEWKRTFEVPDKLVGVYEDAVAWWTENVADVEVKLPLLCTWTGLAAEQRVLHFGFADLATSGVTAGNNMYDDRALAPGEQYAPYLPSHTSVNRMFAVPTDANPDYFAALNIKRLKGDEIIVRDVVGRMLMALAITPEDTFLRRPVLKGGTLSLAEGVAGMINEDYSAFASRDGLQLERGVGSAPSATNTEALLKTNAAINVLTGIESLAAVRLNGAIPAIRASLQRLDEKARELAS